MANIERRRDEPYLPADPVTPAPAERFVRAVEKIAIDAARAEQGQNPASQPQSSAPAPTVIYINNASAPGTQPPPPQAPPTEVHYHTTVQQAPRTTFSRSARKGTSALGMAAVLLGVVACVASWASGFESMAFPVGVIGVGLGVLGWLVAILLGRTGAALPFAGAFISAIAVVISIVGKDATKPVLDELRMRAVDMVEEGKKLIPATETPGAPQNESPGEAPAGATKEHAPSTVVDQNSAAGPKNLAPAPGPVESTDAKQQAAEAKAAALRARAAAQAKLDAALAVVEAALARQSNYSTDQAIAEQADAEVAKLRGEGKSGTPEMSLAAKRALDARTRLRRLRDAAADVDPAVIQARRELALAAQAVVP